MIKTLLFALLLVFSVSAQSQPYGPQTALSPSGFPVVRFYNQTPYIYACWYRDQMNFFVFTLYPNGVTNWQIMYGNFQWSCQGV